MIFVTVGTHEQSFNRLVKEVDRLKEIGAIKDDVFIQTGYSDYEPKHCDFSKFLSFKEMKNKVDTADIVISHGGPASFIAPLQVGKIPVVVPRQFKFDEHVNDHQLDFAKQVESRMKNIIVVEDIKNLENILKNYKSTIKKMKNSNSTNNKKFCSDLENIVKELVM